MVGTERFRTQYSENRRAPHSIRWERGFLIQHSRLGVLLSVWGLGFPCSVWRKVGGFGFSIVKTEEIRIHNMTSISTGMFQICQRSGWIYCLPLGIDHIIFRGTGPCNVWMFQICQRTGWIHCLPLGIYHTILGGGVYFPPEPGKKSGNIDTFSSNFTTISCIFQI